MSMPTGRSEKRTPVELAVLLSSLNETPFKERAFTENVSSRGLRAITKRMWQPGALLLVSFDGEPIPGLARVAYCRRLANNRFAVGLAAGQSAAIGRLTPPRPSAPVFTFLYSRVPLDILGRSWPQPRRLRHHENSCPYPIFPARDRGRSE